MRAGVIKDEDNTNWRIVLQNEPAEENLFLELVTLRTHHQDIFRVDFIDLSW